MPLAFRVLVGNTADRTTPRQDWEAVHARLTDTLRVQAAIAATTRC